MEVSGILEHLPEEVRKKIAGMSNPLPSNERERLERLAEKQNQEPGFLPGYNCEICKNRGEVWVVATDGGGRPELRARPCRCAPIRESMARIKQSGLGDMLERYTLSSWECRESWQETVRNAAVRYAENPDGWFYLGGRPGTGKTHLCTALCSMLLNRGLAVRYMLWRDVSVEAKAAVNDEERYQELVRPLKTIPVLYVDDLFKTGKVYDRRTGQRVDAEPTAGDVNFAFEILNARYNDTGKYTILSSEYSIERLLDIDEGLGSRIYQRSKKNCYDLTEKSNWRIEQN